MKKNLDTSADHHKNIALCIFPSSEESVYSQLIKFIKILEMISQKMYLITGVTPGDTFSSKVVIMNFNLRVHPSASIRPIWWSIILWIFKYLAIQIKMAFYIFRVKKDVDTVIFHYGPHYPLPMILAKLLRKKIIKLFFTTTRAEKVYGKSSPVFYFNYILDKLIILLADRLVVGSEGSIRRFGMEQYKRKMVCSFNHWYLDDMFQIKRGWQQRKYLVGYVGRFRKEKGVLEMARAIHLILLENGDARFLLVGDGVLIPEVKKVLEETNCLGAVDFTGQVAYEKMPEIFNDIKIHILPSIAEVSGAVNMEAMACGTIAIGNAVGGIPDIIGDGKTGFLLLDNQPVTIATKINEVLKRDDLDEIILNAKSYVNENFSLDVAVERWTDILYRW